MVAAGKKKQKNKMQILLLWNSLQTLVLVYSEAAEEQPPFIYTHTGKELSFVSTLNERKFSWI